MTSFMIEEYRQALYMIHEGEEEDEVFNRIFGLTPLELGYHLLSSAHLPDPILLSLKKLPPDALRQATQRPDLQLLVLSDLSVKLSEYALRSDVSKSDFDEFTHQLAARTGRVFGLDSHAIRGLLAETSTQLQSFATLFGLQNISNSITPRLKSRAENREPNSNTTPLFSETLPKATTTDTSTPASPASHLAETSLPTAAELPETTDPESTFQRAFENGIEDLTSLLDDNPISMAKVYNVLLRVVQTGLASKDCLILVRSSPGRPYTCDYGAGKLFENMYGDPMVREGDRNVFGLSIGRLEDIYISDATDARIQPHLPPWVHSSGLSSMIILPIQESRKAFALMIVAWPEKKTVKFSAAQLRQVRALLRLVGTARRLGA